MQRKLSDRSFVFEFWTGQVNLLFKICKFKEMKNIPLIIAISFLTFFSCRKEAIDVSTSIETEDPIEIPGYDPEIKLITGDLFGRVVDDNNNPVVNAEIKVDSKVALTDIYGSFSFEQIQMNEHGTFVTAEKGDFVLGSRLFYPKEGEQSRIKIQLIPRSSPGLIQADQGGKIDIAGGAQVVFESNSFAKQDGSEYLGNVNVYTKYLDPTLTNTLDEMPGALVGIRPFMNNEEVALISFGMLMVELESEDGEKLNLADDSEAEMRMPVPESMRADAPSEIPLWYFNEDIGRWVEDGFAILEGEFYVGKVKHFTFWNCDFPGELVDLKIKVITQDGLPYRNGQVFLKISDQSNQSSGWTNADGIVQGKVLASTDLDADIYDLCGNSIYSGTIGSFDQDSETQIIVETNNYEETIISGVLNCGVESLDNALLIVNVGTEKLFYYVNSTFDVKLFICPEFAGQITCTFYDTEGENESTTYTVDVEEENDLAIVNVCEEELDEYISFNLDGESFLMSEPSMKRYDFVNPGLTEISGQLNETTISIRFHGLTEGDYSGETTVEGRTFNENTIAINLFNNTVREYMDGFFQEFEVTEYGVEDGYLVGSFSGNVNNRDENPMSFPLSGIFRVKVKNAEYDGSYTEIITQGYRHVIPDLSGYLNTSNNVFFCSSNFEEGNMTLAIDGNELDGYEIKSEFLHFYDYSILFQGGPSIEEKITNYGEIGEFVSGYSIGTFHNILRPEVEDKPYYYRVNILRVPE